MTCYTRHLKEAMELAGLPFDPAGKREADRRLRRALSLEDADCPDVWKQVKPLRDQPQVLAEKMNPLTTQRPPVSGGFA
ncbi:MAG: hypothetical protein HYY01_00425 [Chloroflexi bacterium]|nr:hypothetical protein [Chloroflexota bacterium]